MLLALAFSWLLQLLLPFGFATSENDVDTADTISWHSKRLTWDDFTGRPDPRYMNSVALTSSGINVFFRGYEHNPNITVTCTFYRNHSWVKPEGRNKEVLQHEQLHFDIAELHARKLRRAIASLPKSQRTWETIERMYNRANDECGAYQTRYDGATHHSILRDVQQQWNKRVAAELHELSAYASR
jgi:hypothetical protein